jgi:hypothetical protein
MPCLELERDDKRGEVMKSNRPTEPGIHWYRNNYDGSIDGTLVGRPYGRRSGPLMVFHLEDDGWCGMEHFEKCEVDEWIGPAHPPKNVITWHAENGCKLLATEMDVVIYNDVKEFLIGEEDETE